tara:strand:- start:1470 stop:1952 length:483 start_codon:yes stop_codon:yes gene_type:complete
MVNYSNSKIYKLVNNVDNKIYIGSTCNTLRQRKGEHKRSSKIHPERPVYKHLNQVGWENVEIILIETHECKNKDELHKRERHFIDELKPELNKQLPTRTLKEWQEDNKENIVQQKKEWYKDNKEKLQQKHNCKCGGKYTTIHKARHFKSKKHLTHFNSQE